MKVLGQLSHTERYLDQQTNVKKNAKKWLSIAQLRNYKNLPRSCRERQACGKRKKSEEKNMVQLNHFHWSFTFSLSQSEEKNMAQSNQWQDRLCEGNSNVLLVGLARYTHWSVIWTYQIISRKHNSNKKWLHMDFFNQSFRGDHVVLNWAAFQMRITWFYLEIGRNVT